MNYEEEEYYIGCFFSFISLEELQISGQVVDEFIERVNSFEPELVQSGLAYESKVTSIRKRKWKRNKGFCDILADIKDDITEVGYYVYDASWSKVDAPRTLLNIHSSRSNSSQILNVYDKEVNKKANTFFILGVSSSCIKEDDFVDLITGFSQKLKSQIGYIFRNVPYTFNAYTSIEWAYRNIPINIKSKDLNDWQEPFSFIKLERQL